ncbi:MAG: hypothetical protein J7L20_04970 [Thermoplasmata archaeon]|nr:hypothetical protein [Thermoplasmata archaeon]
MRGKVGTIFVLCMLAFAGIGIGYAHWSETLTLKGTLETGELDLDWSCTCSDNDDHSNKNIANVTCEFSSDKNTLWINVTNAYPGYKVSVSIDIENVGTVPAVLLEGGINVRYPGGVIAKDTNNDGIPDEFYYDANGNGTAEPEELMAIIEEWEIWGDIHQIDSGQKVYVNCTVLFTNPGLPEDWSGAFEVTLNFENWSPSTPQ